MSDNVKTYAAFIAEQMRILKGRGLVAEENSPNDAHGGKHVDIPSYNPEGQAIAKHTKENKPNLQVTHEHPTMGTMKHKVWHLNHPTTGKPITAVSSVYNRGGAFDSSHTPGGAKYGLTVHSGHKSESDIKSHYSNLKGKGLAEETIEEHEEIFEDVDMNFFTEGEKTMFMGTGSAGARAAASGWNEKSRSPEPTGIVVAHKDPVSKKLIRTHLHTKAEAKAHTEKLKSAGVKRLHSVALKWGKRPDMKNADKDVPVSSIRSHHTYLKSK